MIWGISSGQAARQPSLPDSEGLIACVAERLMSMRIFETVWRMRIQAFRDTCCIEDMSFEASLTLVRQESGWVISHKPEKPTHGTYVLNYSRSDMEYCDAHVSSVLSIRVDLKSSELALTKCNVI